MGNPFGPVAPNGLASAGIAEMAFTCVLSFVVLAVACSKRSGNSEMFGLAIGSCITAGGFAIGGISGGSLNPAVTTGVQAAYLVNGLGFDLIGELLGHAFLYIAFE